MKKVLYVILFLLGIAIISCTSHKTYFQPSSPDGIARGTGCPQIPKTPDHFYIQDKETKILIDSSKIEEKLRIGLLISTAPDNIIDLNSTSMIIKNSETGKIYLPEKIVTDTKTKTQRVNMNFVVLIYDINANTLTEFQLIFKEKALRINSKDIIFSPINFKKIKTFVISFFTINC